MLFYFIWFSKKMGLFQHKCNKNVVDDDGDDDEGKNIDDDGTDDK